MEGEREREGKGWSK